MSHGKPLTGQGRAHKWLTKVLIHWSSVSSFKINSCFSEVTSQDTVKRNAYLFHTAAKQTSCHCLKCCCFQAEQALKENEPITILFMKDYKKISILAGVQPETAALHDVEQGELTQWWTFITPNLCVFCLWGPSWALVWHSIPGQPQLQMLTSSSGSSQNIFCAFFPFPMHLRFSEHSSHLQCYTLSQITPNHSPSTTAFCQSP